VGGTVGCGGGAHADAEVNDVECILLEVVIP
jgi:hypothetical protein